MFLKATLVFFALVAVMVSCKDPVEEVSLDDLGLLPPDSGGVHLPEYLNPGKNTYGFYIYLPGGYTGEGAAYPLIVFLHGSGERGNSQTEPAALRNVLRNGIPKLIEKGQWDPEYPAIVASPQCHEDWWDAEKIHSHIAYLVKKYNINKSRIYLTGLSMGGFGTFNYLETYGDHGYVAAAVPICGGGKTARAASFIRTPVWAFHGESDQTVNVQGSIDMVRAINALNPLYKAKLTVYPGVGHNSWAMTYDGSGMGQESKEYDPFNQDVFSWMFAYAKSQEKL